MPAGIIWIPFGALITSLRQTTANLPDSMPHALDQLSVDDGRRNRPSPLRGAVRSALGRSPAANLTTSN